MKTFVTLIMFCALWLNVMAQAPQKMSYQAVIRDAGGKLVTNKMVGMRITILQGSLPGTNVYQETQTPTTNANGLVTIEIGGGARFDTIHWGNGIHYIKTETDPSGGTNYTISGTSQLLSVPYALYAKSSGNNFSGDYNDLTNKPVILNNALQTTATGYQALLSNTSTDGTATGYQALWSNTTGNDNTATGTFALKDNSTGWGNTANGSMSLMKNTTGYRNTADGVVALPSNTTGSDNTATGAYTLYNNSIGWCNTAGGARALYSNTEGNYNTAYGVESLYSNTSGSSNTGYGYQALYSNTDGYDNTATGYQSLLNNTDGILNTADGYRALKDNTSGDNNTASGGFALSSNTTGNGNTAIGALALTKNSTGNNNIAIGDKAQFLSETGEYNIAIGNQTLFMNSNGNRNTAVGAFALNAGSDNAATGFQSLYSNKADNNTASGSQSLYTNTTGNSNAAFGFKTLYSNSTGYSNTATGSKALFSNISGIHNTAAGVSALYSNTIGDDNTAFGVDALFSTTSGKQNAAYGFQSGNSNKTGNGNVFLGHKAGYYETGSNNLFIDNQPRAGESDARQKALIYGIFDANPANQALTINGNVSVANHFITNVTNPVNQQDAATKAYVDDLFNQLKSLPMTIIDVDRNYYPVANIGGQFWMSANLRATKYNDGTAIPLVTDDTQWYNLTTPACCWYEDDEGTYGAFGVLYNWYAVNTGKLCPQGWHVPNYSEWQTLINYLGGESTAGGKMKSVKGWKSPNTGATNESGFSGLPGGDRGGNGWYFGIGSSGVWWSSTEASTDNAYDYNLYFNNSVAFPWPHSKWEGFSVRCVRDL